MLVPYRVWQYVATTPWAMTAEKLAEVVAVLSFRASGGLLSPEDIAAIAGDRTESRSRGAVAVIPLRGMIAHRMGSLDESSGGMSVERFDRMITAAMGDASISEVLIDVDSPGGAVTGVHEMHARLMQLKGRGAKRIVAIANGMMASAAYWIASAADEIVAIPSATVGSIGVFSVHEDLSERAKQLGIKVSLISAGRHKTEGNPFEPLTDEGRAQMQHRVDEAYASFVSDVARGRRVAVKDVTSGYGEGRALGARDALAAGLIDRIATPDETIARLTGVTSRLSHRAALSAASAQAAVWQ